MNLTTLWDNAQNSLKEKVGQTSYETWFSTIQVKEKDSTTLVIEAPDDFFKNWIIDHYKKFIEDILNTLSPSPIVIEFGVNADILKAEKKDRVVRLEEGIKEVVDVAKPFLNSRFTFDNFVIGPSNRFASAACLAVAESPARAYNPLFIYGPVGLGKTHLMQAITHKLNQLHPDLRICYISSEKFTNELIDAIRHRSTTEFRKKYREMDVLLIDDIHFIAGKESTQEEFFHTFNNLHNNRKQIIITSDRPPKEIANLEERLSSRFAWGLITDIQPPDYETRVAILRKKVEMETVRVPDDVLYFIAEQVKTNIRELEGALIRVAAYSLLEDRPINLDTAKMILRDMVRETIKTVSVDMIQKGVAEYFKVPLTDMMGQRRNKNIVTARQIAMYLARQLANMSLPEIGQAFGGKDHTTVLHSFKKIEKEILDNMAMRGDVERLTTTLKQ